MTKRMASRTLVSMFLVLLMVAPAFAITLQEAKKNGDVGELRNGYLGIITEAPSAELQKLVNEVNAKRKTKYQMISKKNGTPLNSVETLAGEKAIGKTTSGNYIQQVDGTWGKKP